MSRSWRCIYSINFLYIGTTCITGEQLSGRTQLSSFLPFPEVDSDDAGDVAGSIYPSPDLIVHYCFGALNPLGECFPILIYHCSPATCIDGSGIYARWAPSQVPGVRYFVFSLLEALVHDHSSCRYITNRRQGQDPCHSQQSCQHNSHVSTHVPPPHIAV